MKKSTIYIEVDDEITSIIDKVVTAPDALVVLVLPKRSSVLQSLVNMRLLKRSSDDAKKKLVLVTSEAQLLPIASMAEIYVAKSLSSKPAVPSLPKDTEPKDEVQELALDSSKSIGELQQSVETEETLDLSDPSISKENEEEKSKQDDKSPKKKKLNVPNFDSFRAKLLLGIFGLILVVIGWYVGFVVLPKATIVIKTSSSSIPIDIKLTANTKQTTLDLEKSIVPAKLQSSKTTETEKFTPTGKKDLGTKAKGTMTLTNCRTGTSGVTIPAGTGFSSGDLTYITTEAVNLGPAVIIGVCRSADFPELGAVKNVSVVASSAGDGYNLSARSYNSSLSNISAYGSVMSGGTTKIATVVSQEDIDAATEKLTQKVNAEIKDTLKKQLEAAGYVAVENSYVVDQGAFTAKPGLDTEASEAQVTTEFTFSMYGILKDAAEQLIRNSIKDEFDASKQSVTNTGISTADITVVVRKSADVIDLMLKADAISGPTLNASSIAEEIKGKRLGETERIIKSRPDIENVSIKYNLPWIFNTPKSTSKISISFEASTK